MQRIVTKKETEIKSVFSQHSAIDERVSPKRMLAATGGDELRPGSNLTPYTTLANNSLTRR